MITEFPKEGKCKWSKDLQTYLGKTRKLDKGPNMYFPNSLSWNDKTVRWCRDINRIQKQEYQLQELLDFINPKKYVKILTDNPYHTDTIKGVCYELINEDEHSVYFYNENGIKVGLSKNYSNNFIITKENTNNKTTMDKEKLLKLAKEKYPIGSIVNCLVLDRNVKIISHDINSNYYKNTDTRIYFSTEGSTTKVYESGKWAEIIEQPKVETTKFVEGKWYKYNNWYIKFQCNSGGLFKASEEINGYGKHSYCNSYFGECNINKILLTDLTEIQQYLPPNHSDLIIKDVIPEYVECIKEIVGTFAKVGIHFQIKKQGNIYWYYENKKDSWGNEEQWFRNSKDHFIPSTKSNYLAQFKEEKPMSKFKIGDKVRIINRHVNNSTGTQDYHLPNGDVGKVCYVCDYNKTSHSLKENKDGSGKYYGLYSNNNFYYNFRDSDLELVTEEQWIPKVGDWCISLKDTARGRMKGDLLQIVSDISYKRENKNLEENFSDYIYTKSTYSTLRLALPHEIPKSKEDLFNSWRGFVVGKLYQKKESKSKAYFVGANYRNEPIFELVDVIGCNVDEVPKDYIPKGNGTYWRYSGLEEEFEEIKELVEYKLQGFVNYPVTVDEVFNITLKEADFSFVDTRKPCNEIPLMSSPINEEQQTNSIVLWTPPKGIEEVKQFVPLTIKTIKKVNLCQK